MFLILPHAKKHTLAAAAAIDACVSAIALPSLCPTIALPSLPPQLTLANELCAALGLEEHAHLGCTLAALDDLHLSGLNTTHFLTVLRHAVKAVHASTPSTGQCSTRCDHRGRSVPSSCQVLGRQRPQGR